MDNDGSRYVSDKLGMNDNRHTSAEVVGDNAEERDATVVRLILYV